MTTTVKDVAEVVDAINKVNRDIKDYYWMANLLNDEEITAYIQATKYSDDPAVSSKYETGDPTYRIVQRKIRIEERKKRMIEKVTNLERAVATLEDERERIVIEGLMDRTTLKELGALIGVSKQAVHDIKEKAVRKLAVIMYLRSESR